MSDNHGKYLGPIELAPGVERRHALAYLFAALVSIGLFTYFSALTPYVLRVNLGLPPEEHGRISGDLQTWQEVVLLATIGIWGAMSDRYGRRVVYVLSFAVIALGYALYAFAGTTTELFFYRATIGFGIAGAAVMLTTVLADYPRETSRGKLTGIAFFLNGVGSVAFFLGLTKLPLVFEGRGVEPLWAGRYAFLVAAALAVVTALVLLALKPGRPDAVTERIPVGRLLREGIAAARRPRIALCYFGAFAARADMAIVTLFVVLWTAQSAGSAGLSATEATARAGMVVGIAQLSAVLWSPVFGWLGDRLDRVTVMIVGFVIATIGYGWLGSVDNPGDPAAIPALVALGLGQGSAALASTLLLGQEAPQNIRGSVFGLQSLCGGIGILAISAGGGRLFDQVGPWAPFIAVAIANALVVAWAIALRQAERRNGVSR